MLCHAPDPEPCAIGYRPVGLQEGLFWYRSKVSTGGSYSSTSTRQLTYILPFAGVQHHVVDLRPVGKLVFRYTKHAVHHELIWVPLRTTHLKLAQLASEPFSGFPGKLVLPRRQDSFEWLRLIEECAGAVPPALGSLVAPAQGKDVNLLSTKP